ncbi:hypothetical protein [Demetria terragena]|uniref:hypothetical protein n=1 Tax=Demetria terragena TaxID=63959 RepID=UPI0003826871|nr:hypothetical protein [Demetria terragena]
MSGAQDHHSSAVADEAIRLVSALAAMGTPSGTGAGDGPSAREDTVTADGSSSADSSSSDRTGEGTAPSPCSCDTPAVQAVCEVCPVCRVATFLSEIRPETVERVADLLGMVVGSLEAFAAHRREEMSGEPGEDGSSRPADHEMREGTEWQSVQVDDEDDSP